jgi:tRNA (guanosine-2'-O-)-methyltransferase
MFLPLRQSLQPLVTYTRRTTLLYGGARRKSADNNDNDSLEWERFEFSQSPKWDARFESSRTIIAANEDDLKKISEIETQDDIHHRVSMNTRKAAWTQLSPQLVQRATQVLTPYIQPERLLRMQSVLQQRTIHTSFLFENPSNPSNVFACLRTIESFGIQHVHVVIESGKYLGKAALSQKRGMRTAMGAAQWLTLHNHASTQEAVAFLKQQDANVRLLASDVNPNAKDIRKISWNDDSSSDSSSSHTTPESKNSDRPIVIVMGNEERGISGEMRALVDDTFYLPMQGFAESFNLSVATAITLAHLSAASSSDNNNTNSSSPPIMGPLRPGDMSTHEYNCLILKGILVSIAQRKVAEQLLKREGIHLPSEIIQQL